jgi:hypothetical protein
MVRLLPLVVSTYSTLLFRLFLLDLGVGSNCRVIMNSPQADFLTGPIIRISPNTLDFNTATALGAIHRDRNANVKKAAWYDTIDAGSGARSVQSVVDNSYHAFRRKMLLPAFSETALREHGKFIDNNATIMIQEMCKECEKESSNGAWTNPIDFMLFATWYGFDYTADLAFGSTMNLLQHENRYIPDVVKWTSQFLYYVRHISLSYAQAYKLTTLLRHRAYNV